MLAIPVPAMHLGLATTVLRTKLCMEDFFTREDMRY